MESLYQSQDITELAKALLNVQRHLQPAAKDSDNPFTRSRYASLKSVMDTCRDALLENGIWLCQYPVPVDMANCLGLMTKLTHAESGQWQGSLTVVPLPKPDPQGMGSAITYARRYALTAMLGMVTEDDDGEGAKAVSKTMPKQATPPKRPVNGLIAQKGPSHEETQGDIQNRAVNRTLEEVENLPPLDGITYQLIRSQDGRECIIATGNTHARREVLSSVGFRWNPQSKVWWKYANAA